MTQPLTQVEAMLFGNTRYQRSGWLIPLFVRFVTLGRDEIVERTGISEATAQKYLMDLAMLGIIVRQGYHDGYTLTVGGRQLVAQELLSTGEVMSIDAVATEPTPENSKVQFIPLTQSENQSLINLDPDLIDDDSNHHQSSDSEGAICTFKKMLDHTDILFGEAVDSTGLTKRDFNFTLGWIAQANAQQSNGILRSPQALVYKRLKIPTKKPQKKYFENPMDFLPGDYLTAIGLYRNVCDWCRNEFHDIHAYVEHRKTCVLTHQPEADDEAETAICADETVTVEIRAKWQTVLDAVMAETAKASFETWVRDTEPIHVDAALWRIGVRNNYARDWLESRMAGTIERLLAQSMQAEVGVQFVVAAETEEL